MLVREERDQQIGESPAAVSPPAGEACDDSGAAAEAETAATEERIECKTCAKLKLAAEMSSVSEDCLDCEARKREQNQKQAERDRWADLRAQGKAAFVSWNSEQRGTFSRGTAVVHCMACDTLIIGVRPIERHVKACRLK